MAELISPHWITCQIGIYALRLAVRSSMYSRGEYYRPEYYRRRGLAAKQRAEQSAHPHLKEAFKEVARHWLALAERVEWLDKHYNDQQADKNQ